MSTSTQSDVIKRILSSRTLYEVLDVEKDCTEDQVKQRFRKLSRLVHPDRNDDNKEASEEAFRKINEARDVLSDKERRRYYDLTGETSQRRVQMESNFHSQVYQRNVFRQGPFGQTVFVNDPFGRTGFAFDEDLFELLRAFERSRVYQYQQTEAFRRRKREEDSPPIFKIFPLLFLILLFIVLITTPFRI